MVATPAADLIGRRHGLRRTPMFGTVPTASHECVSIEALTKRMEIHMYIGGGIIGTILVICIVVWLLRRV